MPHEIVKFISLSVDVIVISSVNLPPSSSRLLYRTTTLHRASKIFIHQWRCKWREKKSFTPLDLATHTDGLQMCGCTCNILWHTGITPNRTVGGVLQIIDLTSLVHCSTIGWTAASTSTALSGTVVYSVHWWNRWDLWRIYQPTKRQTILGNRKQPIGNHQPAVMHRVGKYTTNLCQTKYVCR